MSIGVSPFVAAAFLVAGFGASYKMQWQSFFYLWVSAYVTDVFGFTLITFLYVVHFLFGSFRSAAK